MSINTDLMTAEQRLSASGVELPPPPSPFGSYVEAVRSNSLVYFSGMVPVWGHEPRVRGRIGADLTTEQGKEAAEQAMLSGLAAAREFLGSLDHVTRVVKLCVYMLATPDFVDHPKVADGASDLLQRIFGKEMLPVRLVAGLASSPLGMPVVVEFVLEAPQPGDS
ncbi:enamine deaminase RidA (YjgF/YER057c/UK114 family) [Luteibacter sp. OK325]|uniref:RidA family protein n=1 Tax=Luteibacter sp. OK325 TaxID=2135670 RepID=UPI000D488473|nr:RidA family protein [Luteibacter sp. OK325]PTR35115.1 enamine deaminase RidA (YjgF/YER057c/UK114 family) [Luteibacter sp. OK325]